VALTAEAMLAPEAGHTAHTADPVLSPETILQQVETGVLVVDHYGRLRYANSLPLTCLVFPAHST